MTESEPTFGNEPTEPAYQNGEVLRDDELRADMDESAYDRALDHLLDTGVANAYEARMRLGEPASEMIHEQTRPGVSVSLGARATAVATLVDGISMQNKLSGARRHSDALSQYANPAKVLRGMSEKTARYKRDEDGAVETLAQTAALRREGFTEAEIAASEAGIRRNVALLRKTGSEAVKLRNKQKTVTTRTAAKVQNARNKR